MSHVHYHMGFRMPDAPGTQDEHILGIKLMINYVLHISMLVRV